MKTPHTTPKSVEERHALHESAVHHVQGSAAYIDDIPLTEGTLHAAPVLSTVARGQVHGLDLSACLKAPGVCGVVTAADIVGDPVLAAYTHDEPIFASTYVSYVGQVMALVLAQTHQQALHAARLARMDVAPEPPVLDARSALQQQSFVLPPVHVHSGNTQQAWAKAPHQLSGQLEIGGQEHFYLETQIAYAVPQGPRQWLVHSSTQHPGEVQHWVAHALGLPLHAVRVVCRRMGGGFGGKETQGGHLAVWAAVAAHTMNCPVKMRLDRGDDMLITGKRHPFSHDYQAAYDEQGQLLALHSVQMVHCGHSADLSGPVADRAIFHTDNAYFLPAVDIASYRCKTNTDRKSVV